MISLKVVNMQKVNFYSKAVELAFRETDIRLVGGSVLPRDRLFRGFKSRLHPHCLPLPPRIGREDEKYPRISRELACKRREIR